MFRPIGNGGPAHDLEAPLPEHDLSISDFSSLFGLEGQIAVVSGGAGVYGRHIAHALASAGAHVVVAARGLDACQAVARNLQEEGLSATAEHLDLASEASIIGFCQRVADQHGALDILVNNAVLRRGSDVRQTSADDWIATSTVNSLGLFLIAREAGEVMIRQRSGSIINIASIYGVVGPNFPVYGTTGMTSPAFYSYDKGGMISFTRYLATYYAEYGIRVNCISPGGLESPDEPDAPSEFLENYRSRTPLGRLAAPRDIKGPVVFLASAAANYVTGVNLPVDGGWTAW
jgi:NAD(P)-dependent dehydrogenase (short-subunit alcohol dehydrogenase family)